MPPPPTPLLPVSITLRTGMATVLRLGRFAGLSVALLLVGCASGTAKTAPRDGPGHGPAPELSALADAEPVIEPIRNASGNRPYTVMGRSYVPQTEDRPHRESGLASWYGRKFHGRRTANGEVYDMNAMTAAHPTLPLPSYVRVRNPSNGREVIVRVNDRGPFHRGRIIDLSHAAARKLGVAQGVGRVEVERLTFDAIRTGAWRRAPSPESLQVAQLAGPPQPPAAPPALPAAPSPDSWPSAPDPRPPGPPPPEPAPRLLAVAAPAGVAALPVSASTVLSVSASALPPAEPAAAIATATAASTRRADTVPFRAATPAAVVSGGALAGYWVQFGVFKLRDGAESFHRRVVADLHWLAPALAVLSETEFHRLQAGPYRSRDEAHGVAQRVREALSLVPMVVERY